MVKFNVNLVIDVDYQQAIQIGTDIENVDKLFSLFREKIEILERQSIKSILRETYHLPFLKTEIIQDTKYIKTDENRIKSEIITGPLKGTEIIISFEEEKFKTKVSINGNIQTVLKFKPVILLIKKKFEKNLIFLIKNIEYWNQLTKKMGWRNSVSQDGEVLSISINEFNLLLFKKWYNSAIPEIFCEKAYSSLNVDGKTVLDIGANIADSSIYFAAKNAFKVIAVEPFPSNYDIAKENIKINKFENKITLIQGLIANKKSFISIDPEYQGKGSGTNRIKHGNSIKDVKNGEKIPTYTIKNLIEEYNIKNGILKIDCEGCEYDIILQSDKEILHNFSEIFIEYHKGSQDLKEKLKMCGFTIIAELNNKNSGYIFAKKPI